MTFAGVKDIGVLDLGHDVFKYSVGQAIGQTDAGTLYVLAVDYRRGVVLYGSSVVRRSFWQRLRASWRVLRGGLP